MTSPVKNCRRRLVLGKLAAAGEHGRRNSAFVPRYTPELVELVRRGLATAEREIRRTRGRPFGVTCVRITDEGCRAAKEHTQPSAESNRGWRGPIGVDPVCPI
jgi:hypothetical protein